MTMQEETSLKAEALRLHAATAGKISVVGKVPVKNQRDLSLAYSPGVAEPCLKIARNPEDAYVYTGKGNMVAVVSDGSAVLGLGNIGAAAGMPVMEGKALLFKSFAGVDAVPLMVATQDPEEIVAVVKAVSPTYGGVNLEDISAPRCFEIERRLKAELDIPVFHDDQHGTAIVLAAALINALRLQGRSMGEVRVVVEGAGASGIAVSNILGDLGVADLILVDTKGVVYPGRPVGMNPFKEEIAGRTNPRGARGSLIDAMKEADVFIGLAAAGTVTRQMVQGMRRHSIVFACANPVPEIWPEDAVAGGAAIVGTGRSDYPNQINNVLAFPGIFRGALDVRAREINEAMKRAAAQAIANLVADSELRPESIIPSSFDRRVAPAVARAVAVAAIATGVARRTATGDEVAQHCTQLVEEYHSRH